MMHYIGRIALTLVAVTMAYGCTDSVGPRARAMQAIDASEERPAPIHASRGDRIFTGAEADSIIERMARALAATGRPEMLSRRQEATRKYGTAGFNQQEGGISQSADGEEAPIPETTILSVSSSILLTAIPFPDGGSMPPGLSGEMLFVGDEGEIAPDVTLTGANEYEHPVSGSIASGGGSKTCSGRYCNTRKLSGVVQLRAFRPAA